MPIKNTVVKEITCPVIFNALLYVDRLTYPKIINNYFMDMCRADKSIVGADTFTGHSE